MLFNSYVFWLFFALVFFLYRLLPHRGQNWLLLAASYVFYGAWDWRFLFLVLFSTLVDYGIALGLGRSSSPATRKRLITLSVCIQLGLLGFFKYFNFFAHELIVLLGHLGLHASPITLKIILPVGISFYTFQSMSYTIDVYRGKAQPVRNLLHFALYVCFFPQLVAGPIERSSRMLPQFENPRPRRAQDLFEGLHHIILGLFKKVVIADNLAPMVGSIFSSPAASLTGGECWMGVYAFALQIYGDFSGYSSIARGLAKMMGFELMANFEFPYFAVSPSEFWRRWHISLSGWLRDYLYISLGGNRRGKWITLRNLLLTMVLGGLWHGANWTFVAWGAFHGLLLCLWRLVWPGGDVMRPVRLVPRVLGALVMFHLVCIGWLFFRAETLAQAGLMLRRMVTDFQMTSFAWTAGQTILFFAGPLLLYEIWAFRSDTPAGLVRGHWLIRGLAYGYLLAMLIVFTPMVPCEFIYFQF